MIKPGRIVFEMAGIPQNEAYEALRLAAHKLPLKFKLINKEIEAKAAAVKVAKIASKIAAKTATPAKKPAAAKAAQK